MVEIPKHTTAVFFKKKNEYALVIPVINEGQRFVKQLERLKNYSSKVDIIIADGGSTDNSVNEKLLKKNNVRALLIKNDDGKLSAQLRMAYSFALKEGYKGIITIDGNGKDGVEGIDKMIRELNNGYDYVQGSRYLTGGKGINTPFIRHIANHFLHAPLLSLTSGYNFTDTTNGFRAYSKKYLLDKKVQPFRQIFKHYELLAYLTVRASQLGYKVIEVPVTRTYPKGKIPTKISSFKGNLDLLKTLYNVAAGNFNP